MTKWVAEIRRLWCGGSRKRIFKRKKWVKIKLEVLSAVLMWRVIRKKRSMILNSTVCNSEWVQIAHTKEGKIEDSTLWWDWDELLEYIELEVTLGLLGEVAK